MLVKKLFVGVDGGATKCTVRLEDEAGTLMGLVTSGPANIRLSVEQAWQSIQSALNKLLAQYEGQFEIHAGMGLAGCEIQQAKQIFVNHPHPFSKLNVVSDAYTACLGAHGGQDGAIIIIGTGVVGLKCQQGQTVKVGGWGFPIDDLGSGAWLGLEAVKVTLQNMDGRLPASGLAEAVHAHFQNDHDRLMAWANAAHSTQFAELAPVVIAESERQDATAIQLLQRAAQEIERVADALHLDDLPCSLIGGVAPFIEPHLSASLRARLRPVMATPEVGAIYLARQY